MRRRSFSRLTPSQYLPRKIEYEGLAAPLALPQQAFRLILRRGKVSPFPRTPTLSGAVGAWLGPVRRKIIESKWKGMGKAERDSAYAAFKKHFHRATRGSFGAF